MVYKSVQAQLLYGDVPEPNLSQPIPRPSPVHAVSCIASHVLGWVCSIEIHHKWNSVHEVEELPWSLKMANPMEYFSREFKEKILCEYFKRPFYNKSSSFQCSYLQQKLYHSFFSVYRWIYPSLNNDANLIFRGWYFIFQSSFRWVLGETLQCAIRKVHIRDHSYILPQY